MHDPSYRPFSSFTEPPRRSSRWPWAAGLVILVAIAAMTGLLVNGNLHAELFNATPEQNEISMASTAGTGTSVPDIDPIPTAAPTEVFTPTAVDTTGSVRTAENWLAAWQASDYSAMYDMTSTSTQKSITREAFIERYDGITQKAGLSKISASITGDPGLDGKVPYTITLSSSLVGDITESNAIPVVKEGDGWRVAWAPSLIFHDLDAESCVDFSGSTQTRGKILDRNGKVLAEDKVFAQVSVNVGEVSDPETFDTLSQVIDMPADDIRAAIQGAQANWSVPLKSFPQEQSTQLLNELQGVPGAVVTQTTARVYPYGALTAHITGWVSPVTAEDLKNDTSGSVRANEMIGRSGLESGANDLLAGKPDGELEVVDCTSRAVEKVIATAKGQPAQDVYTTIDVDFQKSVDTALTQQVEGDQRAAAVVLDPQTGAVLAMVSHPSFDPNGFVTGTFSKTDERVLNDPLLTASVNRATWQTYPTGSIFKVITTAAALHDLGYTADTQIDCPATFTYEGHDWNDWVVENGVAAQGMLTLHNGLVQSCNSVFYQIGASLDEKNNEDLPDMAKAFGLGAPTGIPYFPEQGGVIPDPTWKQDTVHDGWSTGDAINMAIGQGYVLATPLQMARAYAAIGNGGYVLQPYIVDYTKTEGDAQVNQIGKRVEQNKLPLTSEQLGELQDMLRDQTSNDRGVGSAKVFAGFDFAISGKTGTAENNIDGSDKPHSWFAAYGPGTGKDVQIASCVMFENQGEGGSYAAPVTRKIYEAFLNKGILPGGSGASATPSPEDNP
ncbi:MAG: penicillin-binding transpeptidase domain-containing protein [Thermomicrobiales bacterium]